MYKQETLPLVDFYTNEGILKTFEVKKGLADFDTLVGLVKKELHV